MRLPGFRSQAARSLYIERRRIYLRPPRQRDWKTWSRVREDSREFLARRVIQASETDCGPACLSTITRWKPLSN